MALSIKQKLLLLSLVPVVVLGVVLTAFTVFQVNQLAENRLDSSRTLLVDDREHEAKSLVEIAVSLVKPIYENGGSRDEAVALLSRFSYGESGYFFGYDNNGIRVFNGSNPAGIGNSYWDLKEQ